MAFELGLSCMMHKTWSPLNHMELSECTSCLPHLASASASPPCALLGILVSLEGAALCIFQDSPVAAPACACGDSDDGLMQNALSCWFHITFEVCCYLNPGLLAAIMVFWTMSHMTCHFRVITSYQRMHMLFLSGHACVTRMSVNHSTQAVPCTQHGRTCLRVWRLQALHREC